MDVDTCIRERRSIRKFKDRPLDWEKITRIVDSARFAPSAGNIQNYKLVVIRKDDARQKLASAAFDQDWMLDAPVHIVIMAEPDKAERFYGARGDRLYTVQNCAAAIENMLLTASSLGLASCWVGAFDEEKVKHILNAPDGPEPQAIIVLGYADEKPEMPSRMELEHQVYLDRWGGKGQGDKAKGYKSVAIKESIDNTKKTIKKFVSKIKKQVKE